MHPRMGTTRLLHQQGWTKLRRDTLLIFLAAECWLNGAADLFFAYAVNTVIWHSNVPCALNLNWQEQRTCSFCHKELERPRRDWDGSTYPGKGILGSFRYHLPAFYTNSKVLGQWEFT
ncbi:hypothetical protein BDP27DRAFT_1314375 [Rhodocollybia butyracea]|uniref:Uncharacterized protein n=1 Tax=Rhodocollybia butyracea TaxID=206335 RepID=A0A9P5UE03_9AGAR|nr:hypothetical protein BDP27DRAFT_1314375 [Rhodocollybia butyracea]